MPFIDEKFALMEKAKRQLAKEEAARQKEEELARSSGKKYLTLEEMRAGIKAGQLLLEDETLTFESNRYFDDKMPLIIMKDYFEEAVTQEKAVVFCNDEKGVCMVLTYLPESLAPIPIKEQEKMMAEQYLKMHMYMETTKAVEEKNVDYLCYRVPSSKGWIYDITFWLHKDERRIMGNLNCMDKDRKTYGTLLEALLLESCEML